VDLANSSLMKSAKLPLMRGTFNQTRSKYNHHSHKRLQHYGALLLPSHPHLTGTNSQGQRRFKRSQIQVTCNIIRALLGAIQRDGANTKPACYNQKILLHQGREIIAIVPLENGAFCTIFSENFHKF
jgi:hypothetical protein